MSFLVFARSLLGAALNGVRNPGHGEVGNQYYFRLRSHQTAAENRLVICFSFRFPLIRESCFEVRGYTLDKTDHVNTCQY